MRRLLLAGLAAVALSTGCYPYHHRHHHRPDPVDACLFTTCLADTCLWSVCYDEPREYQAPAPAPYRHHHGPGCGCPYRWDRGSRIYYYDGRWEYEDGSPW